MRKGLFAFLCFVLPFGMTFSQVWIEVKPLNKHIPETRSPLQVNMVNHEMVGLEVIAHYHNTSGEAYWGNLTLHRIDKLPDYIRGWENKSLGVPPASSISNSNIIYIHPQEACRDTVTFYAGIFRGDPPAQHILAVVFSVIIYSTPSSMQPAVIFAEPAFSPGLSNTVHWQPAGRPDIAGEEAYAFDVNDRSNLHHSLRHLYKTLGQETASATFENLLNGHTYGYFIRTDYDKPDRLYSLYSPIIYSRQDHTPPETVRKPLALPVDGQAEITWRPVSDSLSGVSRYEIYRAFDTHVEELVHSVAVTEPQPGVFRWLDAGVNQGWSYYYRIRAVDGVGNVGEGEISDFIMVPGSDPPPILTDGLQNPVPALEDGRGQHIPYIKGAIDTLKFVPVDSRVQRIRFEAAREQLDYFRRAPAVGGRYFDSGWIERPFPPYWVFDYGYSGSVHVDPEGQVQYGPGTPLDLNFVEGRTYHRRMTLDFGTTLRRDTVSVVPDCFPPGDIRNLEARAAIRDPNPLSPDSGLTRWEIRVAWEAAQDGTSGLRRHRIYRRIAGQDAGFVELSTGQEPFLSSSFRDVIPDSVLRIRNAAIHYRVASEDRIGNRRLPDETAWEATDRALGAPHLIFDRLDPRSHILIHPDTLFTRDDIAILALQRFDTDPVLHYLIRVNDREEVHPNTGQDSLRIVLPDEEFIDVRARAVYQGGRSSVWSDTKTVIRTRAIPPLNLQVSSDSGSWEGNLYLNWEKPSTDVVFYEIWRRDAAGDSMLAGIDSSHASTVSWTDVYGIDEMTGDAALPLTAYAPYWYRVRKVNIFGDRSEFSNADSARCNRPPRIFAHDAPRIDGSGYVFQIRWERARPTAVPAGFRTRVRVYRDSLTHPVADEFVVNDDTVFTFRRAAPNHTYIFRIQEIPNDPLYPPTPLSRPYTVSNLRSLTHFDIQPQPQGHIYVNWDNPDLIRTHRISAFQVCRDEVCFRVPSTVTSWMDSVTSLTPGRAYRYGVFGLDSLDQVVAASVGVDTCDTGSVYIPDVLPFSAKYLHDDSITVSWTWRDRSGRETASTRGAARCWIEASLSRSFPDHRDETVATGPFPADADIRSRRVAIPELGNRENENLYFRIRAEDRWGNPGRPLWSTDFYPVQHAIYDDVPPRAVKDLTVVSTAAYYRLPGTVISEIRWSGLGVEYRDPADPSEWDALIANVASYRLMRDGVLLYETPVRPGIESYGFIDTLANHAQSWHVLVYDSAGNMTGSPVVENLGYVPTPEPPDPTGLRSCGVIPLETDSAGVAYSIEIAMNPGHFRLGYEVGDGDQIDRFLCRSGWITDLHFDYTGGWGAIAEDSTWFRVKARRWWRSRYWESGWSETAVFHANAEPTTPKHSQTDTDLPKQIVVHPNYPNPFNAATVISFELPEAGQARILIFNVTGKLVRTLADGPRAAGFHAVSWNGHDHDDRPAASGIYLIHAIIESGDTVFHKRYKMMMVK
ncbi:MAG TPA: T9SS type A sorting domain-containing protein [bacterium]|nr:T9SS type A sorting domain-containing protein [bacterium]